MTFILSCTLLATHLTTIVKTFTLQTTFNHDGGLLAGNMFDVQNVASYNIEIEQFDVNIWKPPSQSDMVLTIYTKSGSYQSYETNSGAWTQIYQQTITAAGGAGNVFALSPLGPPLTISSSSIQAFFIYCTGTIWSTEGQSSPGFLYVSDGNLAIYEGILISGIFTGTQYVNPAEIWNGIIHYSLMTPDPTTPQPTIPTLAPSISPTNPTINPSIAPSTAQPTYFPTTDPTQSPSTYPTKYPTDTPTNNPTVIPSKNPTNIPTTADPTIAPSPMPTSITSYPTIYPTKFPTFNPSHKPTLQHISATFDPSKSPSMTSTNSIKIQNSTVAKRDGIKKSIASDKTLDILIVFIVLTVSIALFVCGIILCRKKKKSQELKYTNSNDYKQPLITAGNSMEYDITPSGVDDISNVNKNKRCTSNDNDVIQTINKHDSTVSGLSITNNIDNNITDGHVELIQYDDKKTDVEIINTINASFVTDDEKMMLANEDKNNGNENILESVECVVCMDKKPEYACVPCGHQCLCQNCKDVINNQCPICLAKSTDVIKIFK